LIAKGSTNKEIATSLHLGEGTVRNYVSSIFGKLGLSNRAEATAYAVRHNLEDYVKNLD
jgi:two-component system response regulator DevR